MLRWFYDGRCGRLPEMPARGFNWKQAPALNRLIQRNHADQPVRTALKEFEMSSDEAHALARHLTYFAANTCSHYRFAGKILRRWLKDSEKSESSARS